MKRNILNGGFSLLKSLPRKYRFVKFLGSETGGPKNGSKLLGKGNRRIPSSHFFTNMEAHPRIF